MRKFIGGLVLSLSVFATAGCSSDCANYCDKWEECIDSNLDVDRCQESCEDFADASDDQADDVSDCSGCIDSNPMCSEVGGACFNQCLGIPRG